MSGEGKGPPRTMPGLTQVDTGDSGHSPVAGQHATHHNRLVVIVAIALLLDNMLLTTTGEW